MNPDARKRQIIQIKAASRAMWRDDEAAMRACYQQVAGATHCRDMTDRQLQALGDYLARASGHKADKAVCLNPASSPALIERVRDFERRPAPEGWRIHPLRTRMVWRRATGSDNAIPLEHLHPRQLAILHRTLVAIYAGPKPRRKPRPKPAPRAAD